MVRRKRGFEFVRAERIMVRWKRNRCVVRKMNEYIELDVVDIGIVELNLL